VSVTKKESDNKLPRKSLNKELLVILKKMFQMVNLKHSKKFIEEFVTDPDWYCKATWTKEQETEFIRWLTDHFYSNKAARYALLRHPTYPTKRSCRKAAKEFWWQYGWCCSDETYKVPAVEGSRCADA